MYRNGCLNHILNNRKKYFLFCMEKAEKKIQSKKRSINFCRGKGESIKC